MDQTASGTDFNKFPSKYTRISYFGDQPVHVKRKYRPYEYITVVPTALWREAEEALREKRAREAMTAVA